MARRDSDDDTGGPWRVTPAGAAALVPTAEGRRDVPVLAHGTLVVEYYAPRGRDLQQPHTRDEVYVVWFAYVLGYWKALCSTSLPDGRYYEVTFHKERQVAFVDTYVKTHNVEVSFS